MPDKISLSRRKFISTSVKGSLAITVGTSTAAYFLNACSFIKTPLNKPPFKTEFDQTSLPYNYKALEGVIDSQTMELHYTKHAAGYSQNLKEAVAEENIDARKSLEEILSEISSYSVKMRNNGGGHYNHELFWKCMRPPMLDNKPSGALLISIEKTFESFERFKKIFSKVSAAQFGSGWGWLYIDNSRNLKTGATTNQDNPLMDVSEIKGIPILGLDVWEHAYYLKYQNKRAEYINNWWSIVNWDFVQQRYSDIMTNL